MIINMFKNICMCVKKSENKQTLLFDSKKHFLRQMKALLPNEPLMDLKSVVHSNSPFNRLDVFLTRGHFICPLASTESTGLEPQAFYALMKSRWKSLGCVSCYKLWK